MAQSPEQDKLPTGKIARASQFLKGGLRVGANVVKHQTKKLLGKEVSEEELDRENAEDLLKTFTQLRGSALKVAQTISLDTINFSKSFVEVMQNAQYNVPPMSGPMVVQVFKRSLGQPPEKVFDKFNIHAVRAASLGQVHEAWKNGQKLAVKIQYPGVADSIQSDMKIFRTFAPRITRIPLEELEPYLQEMEEKFLEEADYRKELTNSLAFKELCKDFSGLRFPEYYPELSGDKVLTMEWLDGLHLREYLATHPPYEERQRFGQLIWDFYNFQIHQLRQVNADPHPGNFLFRSDGTLGVIDFGCTKKIPDDLYEAYFALGDPKVYEPRHRKKLDQLFEKLAIYRPTDTPEKREYVRDLYSRFAQILATPYRLGKMDFRQTEFFEALNGVGEEIARTRELRGLRDFLFLNRTFLGLFNLFHQLGVELDTRCTYLPYYDYSALTPEKKAS
ncbi:MAG: AarF/ABC1/UbiB kinase family protein [Bacteroidetes bacterium]|nr:MAG: AarF/ABC1/UbiB kinase family protein [Bacteroidota bacterium]